MGTSADAFNTKADKMLHSLIKHQDGYKVSSVNFGAVICADDPTHSLPHSMECKQTLINIADNDAFQHSFLFSDTITKL